MDDIEVVVRLNEFTYQRFVDGFANEDDAPLIEKLFKEAILLPKGHGQLIDADKLIKWCESNDDKLMGEYYIDHIVEEPPIIEADKGE